MESLITKITLTILSPFFLQAGVLVFGLQLNPELLFWGAVGQLFMMLVTYSEQKEKAARVATFWDLVKYFAGIVKGAVFAVILAVQVADWVGFENEHLIAFALGAGADYLIPIFHNFIKKKANDKAGS